MWSIFFSPHFLSKLNAPKLCLELNKEKEMRGEVKKRNSWKSCIVGSETKRGLEHVGIGKEEKI